MKSIQELIVSISDNHQLHEAAEAFWGVFEEEYGTYPASIKYHHNYSGGLRDHTKDVMHHAATLYGNYTYEAWFSIEELLFAALVHDAGKVLEYRELHDGKFEYWPNLSRECPAFSGDNAAFLRGIWNMTVGNIGLTSGFHHELASLHIAKFFNTDEQACHPGRPNPLPNSVENAILCHMGGWSRTGAKPDRMAYLLHCADLLGSQFEAET